MSNFITSNANREAAEELNRQLSETIFRSVKDFVDFFNSGLINKRSPEVLNTLAKIKEIYRDVEEKNGKIIFLTRGEIIFDEIMSFLEPWKTIIRVKRELNQEISKRTISPDNTIAFKKGQNVIFVLSSNEDGEELKKLTSERIVRTEHSEILFKRHSSLKDRDTTEAYYFKVNDIISLDEGFLENLYRALTTQ